MSETQATPANPTEPVFYEIRIKGHLDDRWVGRFDDVVITQEENGTTCLTCRVIDQAALHGMLKRVRDLGIPLVSVSPATPPGTGRIDVPDVEK
jgi:hypothetical protein